MPVFILDPGLLEGRWPAPNRAWFMLGELAGVPDRFVHAPWTMPPGVQAASGCVIGRDYPRPIVDHAMARERALAAYAWSRRA